MSPGKIPGLFCILLFLNVQNNLFDKMRFRVQDFIMTDVENLEKIIRDIFGVRKIIKKKRNTNKCIQPLNIYPLNMFAFNFINRLTRLNEKFKDNKIALTQSASV